MYVCPSDRVPIGIDLCQKSSHSNVVVCGFLLPVYASVSLSNADLPVHSLCDSSAEASSNGLGCKSEWLLQSFLPRCAREMSHVMKRAKCLSRVGWLMYLFV